MLIHSSTVQIGGGIGGTSNTSAMPPQLLLRLTHWVSHLLLLGLRHADVVVDYVEVVVDHVSTGQYVLTVKESLVVGGLSQASPACRLLCAPDQLTLSLLVFFGVLQSLIFLLHSLHLSSEVP